MTREFETRGFESKPPIWKAKDDTETHVENLHRMHIHNILRWLARVEGWLRGAEREHNDRAMEIWQVIDFDCHYIKIAKWKETLNNELIRRRGRQ